MTFSDSWAFVWRPLNGLEIHSFLSVDILLLSFLVCTGKHIPSVKLRQRKFHAIYQS